MTRRIMLDTETTGLEVKDGERIIEIGLVEYDGMTPTGRTYHTFVNPEDRIISAGAVQVHGITNEMLKDAPLFSQIVDELTDFINDDDLVIYNAPFDMGFLTVEYEKANRALPESKIIDAFQIVRQRFPRANKSLSAIAKKLGVDISDRTLHGALIDARILGDVYRKLTQQDELVMAQSDRPSAKTGTAARLDARPLLRVDGEQGRYLLRAESTYTLLESALTPEAIVDEAVHHGYDGVCLTDRYTSAGALSFSSAIKNAGKAGNTVKGVIGVALDIAGYEGHPIVFYARTEEGWGNIQRLITLQNVTNKGKGLSSAQISAHAAGLAATGGGAQGFIAETIRQKGIEQAERTAKFFAGLFPDAFALELTRTNDIVDERTEAAITVIAENLRIPVIGSLVARARTGEPEMVEILKAIASNGNYDPDLAQGEDFPSYDRLQRLFVGMNIAVTNAHWVFERCDFLPQEAKPMLPRYDDHSGKSENEIIETKARAALEIIIEADPEIDRARYEERFDYEMELITRLGFSGYFLIVADFIEWARMQGIPVGPGRGSGAGSIVAWVLGITQLDPIKMNLLFERFINPDRVSLPDFDIDFCERRREEVIRYVREKYGQEKVVAIGSYNSFQSRMALKDVGRILGQPHGLMDRISKALPDKGEITPEVIASPEIQSLLTTPESAEALRLGAKLHGLLRNRTRHAAGIVIADRSVSDVASLDLDPNDDRQAITQYDMKPVEKAGLVKFDFLGLKTLTVIERARVNLLQIGVDIDPYKVPLDDPATFEALSRGYTTGVFQMESEGITRACRDIRVDNFEDIVAIIALYRPGPMEFIPLYARRKKGLEPFGTPHPLLDDVARDTYGILVYQEQVMKAAQVLAGYSLGQADLLRRAMGKKIKSEMDEQKAVFIEGCIKTNNIPKNQAIALFEIIERFAMYGFNRSHAAAYGLLSYITAWLVTNHPAAYLAAAMDGATDDSDQMARFAREARKRGIKLLPPQIAGDARYFKAIDDKTIRWSIPAIKGLGESAIRHITSFDQPPANLAEFIEKAAGHINKSQAQAMAAAGVFDEICDRASAVAILRQSYDALSQEAQSRKQGQAGLFDDSQAPLPVQNTEIEMNEILELEKAALGVTLSAHPIDQYRGWMRENSILDLTTAMPLLEHMPVRIAAQVDEAKVGKGRGGWISIRLSDPQSTIMTGCEESLENAHLFQKGEVVIVQITTYQSKGEKRYQIDRIEQKLSEDDKINDIQPTIIIDVGDGFDREKLRRLITGLPEGKSRLHIRSEYGQCTTPPIVEADQSVLDAIDELEGVRHSYID